MTVLLYRLTRDVTPDECSWLSRTYQKDSIVQEYSGCTYGCVTSSGVACCEVGTGGPFFELPEDALQQIRAERKAG